MHALSDPLRVHIFTQIAQAGSSQPCSAFLEFSQRAVPKSTLSQHFKILREAGLIRSERKGVEVRNTCRHDDLDDRYGQLIKAILESYGAQCARTRQKRQADAAK